MCRELNKWKIWYINALALRDEADYSCVCEFIDCKMAAYRSKMIVKTGCVRLLVL